MVITCLPAFHVWKFVMKTNSGLKAIEIVKPIIWLNALALGAYTHCDTHTYTHCDTHIQACTPRTHMYTRTHVHVCAHTHVHIHTHTCVNTQCHTDFLDIRNYQKIICNNFIIILCCYFCCFLLNGSSMGLISQILWFVNIVLAYMASVLQVLLLPHQSDSFLGLHRSF